MCFIFLPLPTSFLSYSGSGGGRRWLSFLLQHYITIFQEPGFDRSRISLSQFQILGERFWLAFLRLGIYALSNQLGQWWVTLEGVAGDTSLRVRRAVKMIDLWVVGEGKCHNSNPFLFFFRVLVDFHEQMFLHFLYALRAICREFKWLFFR